jgi:putative ABC transport system substrate-binding protein
VRRRGFITLLGSLAVGWPFVARAQQPQRHIGVLMPNAEDDPVGQARVRALLDGLRQLGWTDGRNVRIDIRWSAGNSTDTDKYAAELRAWRGRVATPPDLVRSNMA